MRKNLALEKGNRKIFTAVFSRIGKKLNFKGYTVETILLKNICNKTTQKIVADHLWFNYTQGFEKITLVPGTKLQFEARVTEYDKGYINKKYKMKNSTTDYKLSHPTKIKIFEPGT